MEINDRFVFFLRKKGINQKQFFEKTGFLAQRLSNFISGATQQPRLDFAITLLEHFPELNLMWLFLGEGEMWLTEAEQQVQSMEMQKILQENQYLRQANQTLTQENKDLRSLIQSKDEIVQLLRERK